MVNIASNWYDTFAGTADCCAVAEYDKMTDFIQNSAVETFTIWDDVIKSNAIFAFSLTGNDSIMAATDDMRLTVGSGDGLYMFDDATQMFKFEYASNVSKVKGAGVAGDDLRIYVNSGEDYPQIEMYGGAYITLNTFLDIRFKKQGTELLRISNDATYTILDTVGSFPYQIKQGGSTLGFLTFENTGGQLFLHECTTPTAKADYMTLYTKADNKIYCQTGDGVEHEMAFA